MENFQSRCKEEAIEHLKSQAVLASFKAFDEIAAKKAVDELCKKMAKNAYKPQ